MTPVEALLIEQRQGPSSIPLGPAIEPRRAISSGRWRMSQAHIIGVTVSEMIPDMKIATLTVTANIAKTNARRFRPSRGWG